MNSSALLEETTQLEMDNPRKEQEELNLNELNSFLNSIMNKCRSKIFYCRHVIKKQRQNCTTPPVWMEFG